MFDLIPFDRRERNMMRMFDDMEKNFFDGFTTSCKTDIADKGDHYLLEAEMPGFDKENIHIDIEMCIRDSSSTGQASAPILRLST